jgi:hypothetical protein
MKRTTDNSLDAFLSEYSEDVFSKALKLRAILLSNLPDVTEQLDLPARMIGYCYGQRYIDMICTLIPSKKGLKLGFAYGPELPDPDGLLEGSGKLSRYVVIRSEKQINSPALRKLIAAARTAFEKRVSGRISRKG